jgi:hypothetical protein
MVEGLLEKRENGEYDKYIIESITDDIDLLFSVFISDKIRIISDKLVSLISKKKMKKKHINKAREYNNLLNEVAIEILNDIIDTYTMSENKLDKLTTKSESELFLILIEIVRNIKILESNIYHTNILSTNLEEIDNTAKATSFTSLIAAITIIQNNNNIFKRSLG